MKYEPGKRHRLSPIVFGALLACSGFAPVHAQTLLEAACAAFEGTASCRTVSVIDEENCIIKVRPNPVPDLDPEIAGCLIDEVRTRKIFLKNARFETGSAGASATKLAVRIRGQDAVQVLTKYDENGAPVWDTRSAATFEHGGAADEISRALDYLSSTLCSRQTPARGRMSLARKPPDSGNAVARTIGVKDAFRQAAEGRIVLVDIRHESEWRRTGIGLNAVPITMHQRMEDFMEHLRKAAGADIRRPIALICAEGVRSSILQKVLQRNGFSEVLDVHEGMLGDLGWIKSGLPVRPYRP